MKKIGIIIQARANSSRLKGKIFKYLDNKTLLEWVIKRLKKTKNKNIILATGNLKKNLQIKKICKKEKINFFVGSENNVLDRFYRAAKKYKLDVIIRVCADNPFVDKDEINLLVKEYKKTKCNNDYYFNHRNYDEVTYADGFGAELIKYKTLETLFNSATKIADKEHVTSYIWNNKKLFKMLPCSTKIDKKYHHIICDINTINDLKKIRLFIKNKRIKFKDSAKKISKLFSSFNQQLPELLW